MGKVVVVGSSNTDMVVNAPKIPLPGETILGGDFNIIQGGKGANQAVAAARANSQVSFIAKVGNDDFGKQAISGYEKDGINTNNIFIDNNTSTGIAIIIVDDTTGQNSIVVSPGSNGNLSPDDVHKARGIIADADVLLVQLEIPLETVKKALSIAKKNNVKTILNPAPARELGPDILELVDIITPNESETNTLIGIKPECESEIEKAAQILLNKINHTTIITLGEKGVYYASKNGDKAFVPAHKVEAKDTTAAGDVFNGYLAALLSNGTDLISTLNKANKAASISVTRSGAQPSIPIISELNQ